jgi:hypothetical protein
VIPVTVIRAMAWDVTSNPMGRAMKEFLVPVLALMLRERTSEVLAKS